ncbi:MAG: CvpA family protein, partial [Planctomycetota bacterium]
MIGLETMVVQDSGVDASVLRSVEWIDWTAITVLGVFFIMGLFRGFVWQISRILSLLAGFVVAGIYGESGAALIHRWYGGGAPVSGVTVYLAYVFIFLGVVVLLSLVAYFVQKLVKKSGLGFYDRLCGGLLGVATGACVMIFLLSIIYMFLDNFSVA